MTVTPEQFMAQPEPDEEETFNLPVPLSPLETIASAVSYIAALMAEQQAELMPGVISAVEPTGEVLVSEQQLHDTLQGLADLEAKHDVLYALLEEIEAIIKPSVGKLAIAVREAINRWRAPEVPVEPVVEDPEPGTPATHPAHDAGIEIWRTYGANHGVAGAESMNRSQIRSALGIEQPA